MVLADFFESAQARRVSNPAAIRQAFLVLESNPSMLFDLTFYSRFAKRAFDVMQREGKDAEGFAKLQQSFMETVEKIRSIIGELGAKGFSEALRYTSVDAESFQKLMIFMSDFAFVKDWMLHLEDDGLSLQLIKETGSDT